MAQALTNKRAAVATQTAFQKELDANIRAKVRALRKDGTVAMGLDNLRMVTPTPRTTDGAPIGANVSYLYRVMFREAALVAARGFVMHH